MRPEGPWTRGITTIGRMSTRPIHWCRMKRPIQWMALGMIDPLRYPNTDWWDIIMRDGKLQNYNVSATGGSDVDRRVPEGMKMSAGDGVERANTAVPTA